MEQPTQDTSAPDSAVALESDELSENELLDVLADLDGVKRVPRAEQPAAEPEAKSTPVAEGNPSEADKSAKQDKQAEQPAPEAQDESGQEKATNEVRDASDSDPSPKQAKLEKEQARLSESWKRLEEEKAAVRKDADALLQERKRIEDEAINTIARNPASSPSELRKFAEEWEQEGRPELAAEARKQADGIEKAQQILGDRNQRAQRDFAEQRAAAAREVTAQYPEILDTNSEIRRTAEQLAAYDPLVSSFVAANPKSVVLLAHVAKMKMEADSAASLSQEVAKLKSENEQLRKNLSVGESMPSKPSRSRKTFDQMGDKEQEDFLRKIAQEADEGLISMGV